MGSDSQGGLPRMAFPEHAAARLPTTTVMSWKIRIKKAGSGTLTNGKGFTLAATDGKIACGKDKGIFLFPIAYGEPYPGRSAKIAVFSAFFCRNVLAK